MKLLLSQLVPARQFLHRWASGGTWLAIAVVLVVAAWGWLDPFGLRQRLDWMVGDQFLRHRAAPDVHPDLLQISIDEEAVERFGFPIPRYLLARALRQLHMLGARTVLIDILFVDPHTKPVAEEAERWMINPEDVQRFAPLRDRFAEDKLLEQSMRAMDRLVIPFFFIPGDKRTDEDQKLLRQMTDALVAVPGQDSTTLAKHLALDAARDRDRVRRLFKDAATAALERLVEKSLNDKPAVSAIQAMEDILGDAVAYYPYLQDWFQQAFDRVLATRLLAAEASIEAPPARPFRSATSADKLQPPTSLLAAAARSGFADSEPDSDGIFRVMPLVGVYRGRVVFHQMFRAGLAHQEIDLAQIHLANSELRTESPGLRVPLDAKGQMRINWPMNRRRPWRDTIPQLGLSDFLRLDDYERDARVYRHRLRRDLANLDRIVNEADHWHKYFQEKIQDAHFQGRLEEAADSERQFDREAVPKILESPAVRDILERFRNTPKPDLSTQTDELTAYALDVVEILAELPEIERAYEEEFKSLRDGGEHHPGVQKKLCLMGYTAVGAGDIRPTPVDGTVPGITVNVAALNTLLTGRHLHVSGYAVSAFVMMLILAALSPLFLRFQMFPSGGCGLLAIAGVLLGSFLLLQYGSIFFSPVTPIASLVLSYSTLTTFRWRVEYRQKKLVRTIFEAQTNATIVERLIEAGRAGVEEVLTPKNRQVTLFFAEIADFEELAQQVAPERLPELLSRTFGTMDKVIKANEGTLDRYQGHALVAFFGAPFYQPDHAQRACRSALECCDSIRTLKSAWQERGLPVPRVHIGLHTGELLVGNIMLTTRVDYTVAGENLNIAYRIGELNETYGTEVMISEATLTRCENMVEARELDLVRIKGRREPLRAFELMSAKGQLRQEQLQLRGAFATGLVAFRNRDYAGALSMFRSCRETAPGDRPATVYIERCEKELGATVQVEGSKHSGE